MNAHPPPTLDQVLAKLDATERRLFVSMAQKVMRLLPPERQAEIGDRLPGSDPTTTRAQLRELLGGFTDNDILGVSAAMALGLAWSLAVHQAGQPR